MKPDLEQLRALLEDVSPADGAHCGPARGAVLTLVRGERARRARRRRFGLAAAASLVLFASAGLWLRPSAPPAVSPPPISVAHQPPVPPPAAGIRHVNDQQLLDLLQGTPAALMEWPNGERTLLVWGR